MTRPKKKKETEKVIVRCHHSTVRVVPDYLYDEPILTNCLLSLSWSDEGLGSTVKSESVLWVTSGGEYIIDMGIRTGVSTVVGYGRSEKCMLAYCLVIVCVGDFRKTTKMMMTVGYRPCPWQMANPQRISQNWVGKVGFTNREIYKRGVQYGEPGIW